MQVALVEVSKEDRPGRRGDRGDGTGQFVDEVGQFVQRYAHVELDRHAGRADRLGVRLAVGPQSARPAASEATVASPTTSTEPRNVEQVVGRVGAGRRTRAPRRPGRLAVNGAGRDPYRRTSSSPSAKNSSAAARVVQGSRRRDQRSSASRTPARPTSATARSPAGGTSRSRSLVMHGQRALAAAERAGSGRTRCCPWPGRRQPAEDGAVGQDRLDPDDLGPHAAVAEHPDAARVGGDQPADGGRATGRPGRPRSRARRPGRAAAARSSRHAGARGHLCRDRRRPVPARSAGPGSAAPRRRPVPRRRPGRCCRPAQRPRAPAAAHSRTTAATSTVDAGRTTQRARAVEPAGPVHLVRPPAGRDRPVRADGPTTSRSVVLQRHDRTRSRMVCGIARSSATHVRRRSRRRCR